MVKMQVVNNSDIKNTGIVSLSFFIEILLATSDHDKLVGQLKEPTVVLISQLFEIKKIFQKLRSQRHTVGNFILRVI